ncbi:MAG: hypothetical protein JSU87_05550 [Gemmatimonadota bacterium]|nr:MAG: hypothetical protein JSU87_05550 [Gemmatimonadota bacterium]
MSKRRVDPSILPLVALATLLLSSPLAAQGPIHASFAGFGVAGTNLDRLVAGATQSFSGTTVTGEGRLSFWRLSLDARYAEGDLTDDLDNTLRFVEAEALIGIRPIPWINLQFGPVVRKTEESSGSGTVSFWEARALAEAALIPTIVSGHFGMWFAPAADSEDIDTFDNRLGAEAGLVLRAGRLPILAHFGYRISHAKFEQDFREETVQHLYFVLGIELGR